jgi:hypothetical protein
MLALFLFLKGMTGALAPFSYVVVNNRLKALQYSAMSFSSAACLRFFNSTTFLCLYMSVVLLFTVLSIY